MHDDLGVASDEGRVRGVAMAAGARIGEGTGNMSREMKAGALKRLGGAGQDGAGGRNSGGGPQQPTRGDVELATTSTPVRDG